MSEREREGCVGAGVGGQTGRQRATDRSNDREVLDFNVLSTEQGHILTRDRQTDRQTDR